MTPRRRFLLIAMIAVLIGMGFHAYLTYRHNLLHFGAAGEASICNVNQTFNCDAVAASKYSSLFGIPMALFGLTTNGAFLIMLLVSYFNFSSNPNRLSRYCLYMGSFIAGTSIVMGGFSLTLGTYCLFCIAAYVSSFVAWFGAFAATPRPVFRSLNEDVMGLMGNGKSYLMLIIAAPISAWLINQMVMDSYGSSKNWNLQIQDSLVEWRSGKSFDFSALPGLQKGNTQQTAKMQIVEFADFRCPHCKTAVTSVHAFVKSHPDVSFKFLYFPLDGDCNPAIPQTNGLSCHLAKAVHCAQEGGKGWEAHDWIFDQQDRFLGAASLDLFNELLEKMSKEIQLDWAKTLECIKSPAAHEAVKQSAMMGKAAEVQGTPSFYVNGRALNYGQFLPILEKVYNELTEQ